MNVKLEVEPIHGKWWITGMPDGEMNCGAYDTKAEALEDARGMMRFYRDIDKPNLFSEDDRSRKLV